MSRGGRGWVNCRKVVEVCKSGDMEGLEYISGVLKSISRPKSDFKTLEIDFKGLEIDFKTQE